MSNGPAQTTASAEPGVAAEPGLSPRLTLVFAVACGAVVANIYLAQPLIGLISPELGMDAGLSGLIVTLTQLGYGAGLLLLGSLADLVENRRLIVLALLGTAAGLVAVAMSDSALTFLAASFVVGFCAVATQVLVPFASHLAPDRTRGRVIGNIMAGLLGGIMLARPFSSFVAAGLGWRAVFWISAAVMLGLAAVLRRALPRRQPQAGVGYGAILSSTLRLMATTPVLQRRTAYQALMFAAFNLFWTAVPLLLSQRFGLTQRGIALFALAGAGGALAAPLAGRLADRGGTWMATGLALGTVTLSFLLAGLLAGWAATARALAALAAVAMLLDAAVQANQVVGQRMILGLPARARGRVNSIYMTVVFLGGAAGSALASLSFVHGGWRLTCFCGAVLGLLALALFATERRPVKPPAC